VVIFVFLREISSMARINDDQVLAALRAVIDPDSGKDVVTLKMIRLGGQGRQCGIRH
jgi:metal-sulfur cluster biosynthetic enzyme